MPQKSGSPNWNSTPKNNQSRHPYDMMEELGGLEIPMNRPKGNQQNKRLRECAGVKSADFPEAFIVDDPLRKEIK
ncbi:MAG: N-acetylglucosamine-6-sulfatase [Kiritimatiellia bacterium]|jgi:N-acetylglucosamine-6-sulfatase